MSGVRLALSLAAFSACADLETYPVGSDLEVEVVDAGGPMLDRLSMCLIEEGIPFDGGVPDPTKVKSVCLSPAGVLTPGCIVPAFLICLKKIQEDPSLSP